MGRGGNQLLPIRSKKTMESGERLYPLRRRSTSRAGPSASAWPIRRGGGHSLGFYPCAVKFWQEEGRPWNRGFFLHGQGDYAKTFYASGEGYSAAAGACW